MRLFLFPVAVLACAACAGVPSAGPSATAEAAPLPTTYYRIDRLGRPVGWLRHEVVAERRDGDPVLVERMELETRMAREGEKLRFRAEEERVYGADGALVSARLRRVRPGLTRESRAACDADGCEVVTSGDGPAVRRRLPPTTETRAQALAAQLALREGTLRFTYLDLEELQEVEREAVAAGAEPVPLLGGRNARRVEIRTEGEAGTTVEWLADDGAPLGARFSDGAELVVLPEAQAKAESSPVDLAALAVLPLPQPIERGRPVDEVRVVFDALPESARLPAPYRRYEELPDGAVRVTTVAPELEPAPLPIPSAGFERELAATADLDHDSPAIRGLIARIPMDRLGNSAELAALLTALVGQALPVREDAGVDRASQILAGGKGGPADAATLFVALARAAGLPARIVNGYVYAEDEGVPLLVWSAWAEVYVGAWVEVDPFLGELPANALHLPVGREGVGDSGVGLLGRLGVRSFETSARVKL